jgi:hypothetical protein
MYVIYIFQWSLGSFFYYFFKNIEKIYILLLWPSISHGDRLFENGPFKPLISFGSTRKQNAQIKLADASMKCSQRLVSTAAILPYTCNLAWQAPEHELRYNWKHLDYIWNEIVDKDTPQSSPHVLAWFSVVLHCSLAYNSSKECFTMWAILTDCFVVWFKTQNLNSAPY